MNDHRLCFVEGPWAYFTTKELSKQWGDDWNDAPYEHNAGPPYRWREETDAKLGLVPWEIVKVAWDGPLVPPCEGHVNSPYSVEEINRGAVAWLRSDHHSRGKILIPAGTTLHEFFSLVEAAGGHVYVERSRES